RGPACTGPASCTCLCSGWMRTWSFRPYIRWPVRPLPPGRARRRVCGACGFLGGEVVEVPPAGLPRRWRPDESIGQESTPAARRFKQSGLLLAGRHPNADVPKRDRPVVALEHERAGRHFRPCVVVARRREQLLVLVNDLAVERRLHDPGIGRLFAVPIELRGPERGLERLPLAGRLAGVHLGGDTLV